MMILSGLCVLAAVVSVFAGKAVIAAAIAHVEEVYPAEYERLSRHGVLFSGMQGSVDRARRGIAGPLLTGFLPQPLRGDPVLQKAKALWRLAFIGMIGFFTLSIIFLFRSGGAS